MRVFSLLLTDVDSFMFPWYTLHWIFLFVSAWCHSTGRVFFIAQFDHPLSVACQLFHTATRLSEIVSLATLSSGNSLSKDDKIRLPTPRLPDIAFDNDPSLTLIRQASSFWLIPRCCVSDATLSFRNCISYSPPALDRFSYRSL